MEHPYSFVERTAKRLGISERWFIDHYIRKYYIFYEEVFGFELQDFSKKGVDDWYWEQKKKYRQKK